MFDVPQILTNGKGNPDRCATTMIMYLNNHMFSKNYGHGGRGFRDSCSSSAPCCAL